MAPTSLHSKFLPSPHFSHQTPTPKLSPLTQIYSSDFRPRRLRRQVEEGMVALRRRIQEKTVEERNYRPPAAWMDWEKQIYASYPEFVSRAMAALQSRLLNTRPAVALAVAALLAASVPISAVLLFVQIVQAVSRGGH